MHSGSVLAEASYMVAAGAAPAPDAAIVGSLIGQLVGWSVLVCWL